MRRLYRLIFPSVLIVLGLLISWKNFQLGTWLSGWDTLHPEFDFLLNLQRVISGVWREEQGLGALAAHSHMIELPRILLLWLASIVVPVMYLRYLYVFLCLILGILGVYVLVSDQFSRKPWSMAACAAGFLAGLVYLFNLGTLQHFYVPFEMFTTQFAFLPWIFLVFFRFLKHGGLRLAMLFVFVNLMASSMAYASLLWYAFAASLGLSGLILLALTRTKVMLSRVLVAGLLLVVANAYWILPNFYFVLRHSDVVEKAMINQNFSPEAFLHNKSYGTLADTLILKNFLFSWLDYDYESNQFVPMMQVWNEHLSRPGIMLIGYLVAGLSVVGLIAGMIFKQKKAIALLPGVLLAFVMLINMNPPFEAVFGLLRDNVSLFREGLRFPFTKFSIILMLGLAVYTGVAVDTSLSFLNRKLLGRIVGIVLLVVSGGALVWYGRPFLEGHLINPRMRIEIPDEYFELYSFMSTLPEGRLLVLPAHSMWGWEYYSWEYQGAGFFWFGSKHPTLVRDFDRWNPANENFYQEMSNALYNQQAQDFFEVVGKYKTRYVLFDKSMINTGGDEELLLHQKISEILSAGSTLLWEDESLQLYEISQPSLVEAYHDLRLVSGDLGYIQQDLLSRKAPYAITSNADEYIPFMGFDDRNSTQILFVGSAIEVTSSVQDSQGQYNTIQLPEYLKLESMVPIDVYGRLETNNLILRLEQKEPVVLVNGHPLHAPKQIWVESAISLSEHGLRYAVINETVLDLLNLQDGQGERFLGSVYLNSLRNTEVKIYSSSARRLGVLQDGLLQNRPRLCSNPNIESDLILKGREFTLEAQDESICLGSPFEVDSSVLLQTELESQTDSGLSPWFCITSPTSSGCVNEVLPIGFQQKQEWSSYYYTQMLDPGKYFFDFVVQGQQEPGAKISYRNLNVYVFDLIYEDQIDVRSLLAQFGQSQTYSVPEAIHSVGVSLPFQPVIRENFQLARGNPETNCSVSKQGVVSKKRVLGGVLYEAQMNGVSCDYYDYQKISHSQPLLLRVKGQNFQGRGMKYYLNNLRTKRMDIEQLLPQDSFDQATVLFSQPSDTKGYVINLETRAFRDVNSSNLLEEISFWPFPVNWLAGIELSRDGQGFQYSNSTLSLSESETEDLSYNQSNLFVKVKGAGVLGLHQAHHPGWLAFLHSNPSALTRFAPWLGGQKLEHVKVNGWANGWLIEEGQCPGECSVTMFFWPQLLQWAGFGVLGMTVIGLVGASLRFRKGK